MLPTVKLGSLHREDPPSLHDIEVDFQPSPESKFGFAWPGGVSPHRSDHPPNNHIHTPASEETDSTPTHSQDESPIHGPSHQAESNLSASPMPRLSRAFSMPLPSQIAHFQHPARTPGTNSPPSPVTAPLGARQFQELSCELADSLQTAIRTLLQLSPPQVFDSAKEQFSSYAVQIPTTSISALLTSMKNLNYMSANMHRFGLSAPLFIEPNDATPKNDFDIGELLQSVGDSLSGVAAEAEVDLVLYHGDAAIKHIGVKGDECGISYALTHILHQVLLTTKRGDSIEVGLSIIEQPSSTACDAGSDQVLSSQRAYMSSSHSESPTLDNDGTVVCTFDIAHKFLSSIDASSPCAEPSLEGAEQKNCELRAEPQLDTTILRQLLRHIGGTLRPSLQPQLFRTGRRCELVVTLERGVPISSLHRLTVEEIARQLPNRASREPTLEELTSFTETLRGKKVAFHASSQGSFAHHLTRYLTAWGMDISHVPTDDSEEKELAEDPSLLRADSAFNDGGGSSLGLGLGLAMGEVNSLTIDSASDSPEKNKPPKSGMGLSFVIIDDDVRVLRHRLLQHRAEFAPSLHLHSRKQRPSLAANHRPRSSPSIRNTPPTFSPVPIVHFTSLANYKVVKHAIQASSATPGPPSFFPEVIVIPKPAGPRRLLTALHTAVDKPIVDPFFSPIAVSPMASSASISPLIPGRKVITPPAGLSRPPRSSPENAAGSSSTTLSPSSPLALSDRLDYFPDATVKKLGGNAASGLVIQSPDGRPAGIFFQPRSRAPSSSRMDPASLARDRERGLFPPGGQRMGRLSCARKISTADNGVVMERTDNATPTLSTKPSSGLSGDKLELPSQTCERPRAVEPTEILRPFKGKGRIPTPSREQESSHALSLAAWRETTQNLANPSPSPASNTKAASITTEKCPTTDVILTSPRKTSQTKMPSPVSRSPTSPSSPDTRKPIVRRTSQVSKVAVATPGVKKPKTVGSNIVPPISVLIVEDNAINQTILSTFMRRNKIKYEVAWNGREAVEKWRHGNFHLILMDIQMPVMDGIEATKEIRRLEQLEKPSLFPSPGEGLRHSAETPDSRLSSASSTPFRSQVIIVALTASSLQSDRVAALAAGCNDFLTKPVTNSWLNDKVIEWGSIKALQMWAELRPEMAKSMKHDQDTHAKEVASKLHVPSPSVRKSPLSGGHISLSAASQDAAGHVLRMGKRSRRASDKRSYSSGSSPERSSMSSDDEAMRDPITEPPAVIETPEHRSIALPELNLPTVSEDDALHSPFDSEPKYQCISSLTFLGQRAKDSFLASMPMGSITQDTVVVADSSSTRSFAAAGTPTDDAAPSEPPTGDDGHPTDH